MRSNDNYNMEDGNNQVKSAVFIDFERMAECGEDFAETYELLEGNPKDHEGSKFLYYNDGVFTEEELDRFNKRSLLIFNFNFTQEELEELIKSEKFKAYCAVRDMEFQHDIQQCLQDIVVETPESGSAKYNSALHKAHQKLRNLFSPKVKRMQRPAFILRFTVRAPRARAWRRAYKRLRTANGDDGGGGSSGSGDSDPAPKPLHLLKSHRTKQLNSLSRSVAFPRLLLHGFLEGRRAV